MTVSICLDPCRELEEVNMGWCEAITNEGFKALADNCAKLASLDLCGCIQASCCFGLHALTIQQERWPA